jgi:hypothetical protein
VDSSDTQDYEPMDVEGREGGGGGSGGTGGAADEGMRMEGEGENGGGGGEGRDGGEGWRERRREMQWKGGGFNGKTYLCLYKKKLFICLRGRQCKGDRFSNVLCVSTKKKISFVKEAQIPKSTLCLSRKQTVICKGGSASQKCSLKSALSKVLCQTCSLKSALSKCSLSSLYMPQIYYRHSLFQTKKSVVAMEVLPLLREAVLATSLEGGGGQEGGEGAEQEEGEGESAWGNYGECGGDNGQHEGPALGGGGAGGGVQAAPEGGAPGGGGEFEDSMEDTDRMKDGGHGMVLDLREAGLSRCLYIVI